MRSMTWMSIQRSRWLCQCLVTRGVSCGTWRKGRRLRGLIASPARGQSTGADAASEGLKFRCCRFLQWKLFIKDTLNKRHLSNEDTVCCPNHRAV